MCAVIAGHGRRPRSMPAGGCTGLKGFIETALRPNDMIYGVAGGRKRSINATNPGGAGASSGIDGPGCRSFDSTITSNSNCLRVTSIFAASHALKGGGPRRTASHRHRRARHPIFCSLVCLRWWYADHRSWHLHLKHHASCLSGGAVAPYNRSATGGARCQKSAALGLIPLGPRFGAG